jgi:hypothetical protein
LIGTKSNFIAGGTTHFGFPICNPTDPAEKMAAAACTWLAAINPFSGIPVAPSLANCAAGNKEARPCKEPFLHRQLVPKIRTPRVAH